MGWEHHAFFPFGPIFGLLLIGFVFFWLLPFRRFGWGCRGGFGRGYYRGFGPGYHGEYGPFEAEAILRRRLANGEIDEAEYQRLKEILSK